MGRPRKQKPEETVAQTGGFFDEGEELPETVTDEVLEVIEPASEEGVEDELVPVIEGGETLSSAVDVPVEETYFPPSPFAADEDPTPEPELEEWPDLDEEQPSIKEPEAVSAATLPADGWFTISQDTPDKNILVSETGLDVGIPARKKFTRRMRQAAPHVWEKVYKFIHERTHMDIPFAPKFWRAKPHDWEDTHG